MVEYPLVKTFFICVQFVIQSFHLVQMNILSASVETFLLI